MAINQPGPGGHPGNPGGSAAGDIFNMSPEELAALQPPDPNQFSDPAMQQQQQAMNARFTQTQQALKQAIRNANQWQERLPDIELMQREHTWMRNNPQIKSYLEGIQNGSISENDSNGFAAANRGNGQSNQQAPGADQSGPWNNLPDPMVDPQAFGQQLQAGINSMLGSSVNSAVGTAINDNIAPLLRELTNRELGRSTQEQQQRYASMEQTYPDWNRVKDAVIADLQAYPGMDIGKAYRANGGEGVTYAEAARKNLTPASGIKRHADDGPKNPKDWESTEEFVEQRLSELAAPAPAQSGMPGLPGISGPGSQLAPAGVPGRY